MPDAPQSRRPLDGRTIVVTRAAAQAQRFTELLEEAGARVLEAPAIVIAPPPSWEPLDAALDALGTFTWVIFTSVNGVAMVDRRLPARGLAWGALAAGAIDAVTFTSSSTARNFAEMFTEEERRSWLGRVTVASIGPITAATATEYGLTTAVMPGEYTIPALARALAEHFARIPRGAGRRARRSV